MIDLGTIVTGAGAPTRSGAGVRFKLDADFAAGQTFAILAKKGAGKTFTGRVMAEEFYAAGVPFVVMDPTGAWWGLRTSADGKSPGLPVLIFGGKHADVPLERGAGAVIADLLINHRVPMVLDLSEFGSHAAERQFAHDFLERLYRRNSELLHIFCDEADLFAPQKPQPGDAPLLGVMENIVRRGRIKGLTITLITQRSAVLNKDVLTQADVLVLLRLLSPQDRKAALEWVRAHSSEEAQDLVMDSLASLQNGEGWWWAPEANILERVQVRMSNTYDSSPTPGRAKRVEVKTMADVDLDAVRTQIADTIERAEADDPKKLRKRIAELEKLLRQAPAAEPERIEVPVLPRERLDHLEATLHDVTTAVRQAEALLKEPVEKVVNALGGIQTALASVNGGPPRAAAPRRAPAPRVPEKRSDSNREEGPKVVVALDGVKPAQQKILDALASLEAIGVPEPDKTQLALFVGVSPTSGGYFNNLGKLRSGGLIEYPSPGTASLTEDGREIAAADGPTTIEELHDLVRSVVKPAQWRVLEPLIEAYPDPLGKDDLAEAIGVSPTSGGYFNNLGKLRSLGLIDYPSPGQAVALPVLFLEGA